MIIEWTIRLATENDAPAMARLLEADDIAELCAWPLGPHYLLVAEDEDGSLAALAVIRLVSRRAELRLLVMAPAYADEHLTEGLIEAAEALSMAWGCETFQQSSEFRGN